MQTPSIITNETRELVASIESTLPQDPGWLEYKIRNLVGHVAARCALPEIKQKYEMYGAVPGEMAAYPTDHDGYAQSFDALSDETDMYDHWRRLGVIVGKQVATIEACDYAVHRVLSVANELSDGSCFLGTPGSHLDLPFDDQDVPILTRGFFELYHDNGLAQLRQSVRSYLHHVVVRGRADLWTTFDRYGVKLPGDAGSAALPLHVDQNPREHSDFRTTQGVLALEDCPLERGTLAVVPGSKKFFAGYGSIAPEKGEYVQLIDGHESASVLRDAVQPLPLRSGDIATWDSRTTHANTENVSDKIRYVALISAGPVPKENCHDLVLARSRAYYSGEGSNNRDALMHASMKPRYSDSEALASVRQPERLSLLGKLLYGQKDYDI
jgi:hypothetical protein